MRLVCNVPFYGNFFIFYCLLDPVKEKCDF